DTLGTVAVVAERGVGDPRAAERVVERDTGRVGRRHFVRRRGRRGLGGDVIYGRGGGFGVEHYAGVEDTCLAARGGEVCWNYRRCAVRINRQNRAWRLIGAVEYLVKVGRAGDEEAHAVENLARLRLCGERGVADERAPFVEGADLADRACARYA